MPPALMTVAETSLYTRKSLEYFEEDERRAIVDFLSSNPTAGVIIEGTGGVRKIRWALPGGGKSGGVRIIYYYHSERMPLWLLTMFAKNEQSNLTKGERNALAGLVNTLKKEAGA